MTATDFRTAVRQNRRNTYLLLFALAAIAALFGFGLGVAADVWIAEQQAAERGIGVRWTAERVLDGTWASRIALATTAIMIGWTTIATLTADRFLLASIGARPAYASDSPVATNVVQEMAVAAQIAAPKVFVIDDTSLNALAVARRRDRGAVCFTSGLLEKLDREELQGVAAHEVAHIAADDSTYATIAAVAAGVLAMMAYVVQRNLRHGLRFRPGRGKGAGAALLVVALVLVVFSIITPFLARLVQFAISREREYHADAEAARLTRNPAGLIRALEKLRDSDTEIDTARNSPIAALCIARSDGHMMSGMFATHPPIDERIHRLKNLGG